ncbi:MAG: hypothetical protein ACI9KE_005613 [Polyangiales bacterium]
MRQLFFIGIFTALCAFAPDFALAQEEQDTAAARTLFHEGIACADIGDDACAADRFRRSNDLRPSSIVVFNQAQAEVELGHFVVASELYRSVLRSAEGELAQAAQHALDAVMPRLAHVTIVVDTTARVMLDEFEMQAAIQGVAIPLDPGEHQLHALYGDAVAAEYVFSVGEGETITHTFEVPPPVANLVVQDLPEEEISMLQEEEVSLLQEEEPVVDHTTRRRVLGVTFGIVAAVGIAVLVAILLKPSAPDPTQTDLPPVVFE